MKFPKFSLIFLLAYTSIVTPFPEIIGPDDLVGVSIGSTVSEKFKIDANSALVGRITKIVDISSEGRTSSSVDINRGKNEDLRATRDIKSSSGVPAFEKAHAGDASHDGSSSQMDSQSKIKDQTLIEHVDFDQLTVSQILSSMSKHAKECALEVLNFYNVAANRKRNGDAEKHESAIKDWFVSLDNFFKTFGKSVVIGALWGRKPSDSKETNDPVENVEYAEFSQHVEFSPPPEDPLISKMVKEFDVRTVPYFEKRFAYNTARKSEPDMSEKHFENVINKKANYAQLKELVENAAEGNVNTLALLDTKYQKVEEEANSSPVTEPPSTLYKGKSISASPSLGHYGFKILGVWFVDWSQLFPWMATGRFNDVKDISSYEEITLKTTMLRDFLALRDIYANIKRDSLHGLRNIGIDSPIAISESFARQAGKLKEEFSKKEGVKNALLGLSGRAKRIYKKWNELKILRNAGGGLGFLYKRARKMKNNNVCEYVTIDDLGRLPFKNKYALTSISVGKTPYYTFRSYPKFSPLIGTNQKLYAMAFGMFYKGTDGFCAKFANVIYPKEIPTFDIDPNSPHTLTQSNDPLVRLIPVQCAVRAENETDASESGDIFAYDNCLRGLLANLKLTIDELKKENSVTFFGAHWVRNWELEKSYSLRNLKAKYVGIVEARGNLFKQRRIAIF